MLAYAFLLTKLPLCRQITRSILRMVEHIGMFAFPRAYLVLSKDGETMAIVRAPTITIVSTAAPKLTQGTLTMDKDHLYHRASFSPDGRWLALAQTDPNQITILIFCLTTFTEKKKFWISPWGVGKSSSLLWEDGVIIYTDSLMTQTFPTPQCTARLAFQRLSIHPRLYIDYPKFQIDIHTGTHQYKGICHLLKIHFIWTDQYAVGVNTNRTRMAITVGCRMIRLAQAGMAEMGEWRRIK